MNCANCGERPAAKRSAHCERCLKYRQRHDVLPAAPPRTYGHQWETLKASFRAWLAAESDEDFVRRKSRMSRIEDRIRKAAIRYADSVRAKGRNRTRGRAD